MIIKVDSVNPLEFCILVAWMKGATIGEISRTIGIHFAKSEASIRGIVNHKMSRPRAEMSIEERQRVLNALKEHRKDGGKLGDTMFVAKPLKTKAKGKTGNLSQYRIKPPLPVTQDISSMSASRRRKAEKKRLKELKERERAEEIDRIARQDGKNMARGIAATPLEYLDSKRMLSDVKVQDGSIDKSAVETSRLGAGRKMRELLAGCQISTMKSQDFEMIGGGTGMGVSIPAKIQEYQSQVRAIREMMTVEDFRELEKMLQQDAFVWMVPSKKAEEIVLESLRRSLDAVSVFLGMLTIKEFSGKWGYMPTRAAFKTKQQSRRDSSDAKDLINQAQRDLK